MGTWGALVEQWLHDLLPADAAERCRGEVSIVVTQLPFCNQVAISDYKDKADLINVAMASAHVPLFLVSECVFQAWSGGGAGRLAGCDARSQQLLCVHVGVPAQPTAACPLAATRAPQDWKVSRECRGVQCLDGSFPDFFVGENCDLLQCGGEAVMFDYFHDPNIVRNGRMDMLSLKQFE
jgi:hypothetical protein